MLNFLLVIDVLIAIGLIALILLQRGPGATAGAAFGSGASGTVFGARGSANFLSRSTGGLAAAFLIVTLVMAMIASRQVNEMQDNNLGVMSSVPAATAPADAEVPAMEAGAEDAATMDAMNAEVPVMGDAMSGDAAGASDTQAGDTQSGDGEVPAMMEPEQAGDEAATMTASDDGSENNNN